MKQTTRSLALGATLAAFLLVAATAALQAQTTTKQVTKQQPIVSTTELKGEVVKVEGTDLLVKLSSGDLQTFHVPATRKFAIDGKEVSVQELKPGTTLTAKVKTTMTPVTVRTKSTLTGKVWFASGPTVILTLPSGENKQYVVKDDVKFTVSGSPATVFDLRPGMNVTAEKIVEAPDVEIVRDSTVSGHAPAAPAAALTPTAPNAKTPAALPSTAAPGTSAPAAGAPTGAPAGEPAAPPAAAPAGEPAAAPAAAPAAETPIPAPATESGRSPLVWVGLILVVVIVGIVLFNRRGKK
jgi:putative sterol carrier protein